MIIKVKSDKKAKAAMCEGKLADVQRLVRKLLAAEGEENAEYSVGYLDSDKEFIEITDQEDLDTCIEDFKFMQQLDSNDRLKITLFLRREIEGFEQVVEGNNPLEDSLGTSKFLQDCSMASQISQQIESEDKAEEPVVEDDVLMSQTEEEGQSIATDYKEEESLREVDSREQNAQLYEQVDMTVETKFEDNVGEEDETDNRLLMDNDETLNLDVNKEACNCQINIRDQFQKLLLELLTTKDDYVLYNAFPILFEPSKLGSHNRRAVTEFLNRSSPVTQQPPQMWQNPFTSHNPILPDTHLRDQNTPLPTPMLFSEGIDFSRKPVHVETPVGSPSDNNTWTKQRASSGHLPERTNFFQDVIEGFGSLGRDIKGIFKPSMKCPSPSCHHCQAISARRNQAWPNAGFRDLASESHLFFDSPEEDRELAEAVKDVVAPPDFSVEQRYLLLKLKNYLKTEDIEASALFWIKANWRWLVRGRSVVNCYPDIIATMEQCSVIPAKSVACTITTPTAGNSN